MDENFEEKTTYIYKSYHMVIIFQNLYIYNKPWLENMFKGFNYTDLKMIHFAIVSCNSRYDNVDVTFSCFCPIQTWNRILHGQKQTHKEKLRLN